MPTPLRIATFNLEELDDKPSLKPTFLERLPVMRPQVDRLRADILCLQEVHAQEQAQPGQPRELRALKKLIVGTPYEHFQHQAVTGTAPNEPYAERNLVILSRFPIANSWQFKHNKVPAPKYKKVTAIPPSDEASDQTWERPILYAKIDLPGNRSLHVINLHLKSKTPTDIRGQKIDEFTWKTAHGWAEGFFVSSMKRVGQAVETRFLIDELFDADAEAWICVCGDFNADTEDVPVQAIRGDVENTGNKQHAPRAMVPCELTIPEPARFSIIHRGKGYMFDHLLVSRPLLAIYRRSEIHNEVLHDESVAFATDVKFPESDHAPVVAEFELP